MNDKYKITVTSINHHAIYMSRDIDLLISSGDCSVLARHITISEIDYKRIMMAINSVDVCAEDYERRIKEHNDNLVRKSTEGENGKLE